MENIAGGESGVMCCELTEAENVEHIFFLFFSVKNSTNLSAKAEGALSMGGSCPEVCVAHHPGHAIIFVGCGDYPEFLL